MDKMKYIKIIDALKSDSQLRLSYGNNKWMYFDEATKEWVVCVQRYRARKVTELCRDKSEMLAINILCE